jgi:hypothetical protein
MNQKKVDRHESIDRRGWVWRRWTGKPLVAVKSIESYLQSTTGGRNDRSTKVSRDLIRF